MKCENAMKLLQMSSRSEADEAALQEHLRQCPDCRQFAQFLQECDSAVQDLMEEPPERLVRGVMWQIAPERMEQRSGKTPRRRVPFVGTAIAAVLALVLVGVCHFAPWSKEAERSMELPENATLAEKSADGFLTGATDALPLEAEYAADEASAEISSGSAACTAVLTSGEFDAPEGCELLMQQTQVADVKAWLDSTIGSVEEELPEGTCDIALYSVPREILQSLQTKYDVRVESLSDDWEICTLAVITPQEEK